MGIGGHEYVIYENGEIEGFGEGAIIFNNYPQLLASEVVQASKKGRSAAPSHPATILTHDREGIAHPSAP